MEKVMVHVANGLLHFGWAVTGQGCNGDCPWPKFNWLATLMAGFSNKMYGMPWHDGDFTEEDKRIWWEAVESPHLLGRITEWIYAHLHDIACDLDRRYDNKLL